MGINLFKKYQTLCESIQHPMIEHNGKTLHKTNSEGQLIHHTDDGIKAFHDWFGDSKTVDEHGRPKVMYHGTSKSFSEFDNDKWSDNTGAKLSVLGHYFTGDSNLANAFTRGVSWYKNGKSKLGSNIMPTYLSMKSPKVISGREWTDMNAKSALSLRDYKNDLIDKGHDGIIIKAWEGKDPTKELSTPQYVSFDSKNIKSSIGNSGKFSPESKNINESEEIPKEAILPHIKSLYDSGRYDITPVKSHNSIEFHAIA